MTQKLKKQDRAGLLFKGSGLVIQALVLRVLCRLGLMKAYGNRKENDIS